MLTKNKDLKGVMISIPADFTSLHDLKELVSNYEFVSKLQNALNSYQQFYVESFLHDIDSLLKYIPLKQHKEYSVNNGISYAKPSTYIDDEDDEKYNLYSLINRFTNDDKDGKFLVNTIDKQIDYFLPFNRKYNSFFSDRKYTGNVEYFVDSENHLLNVRCHYTKEAQQAVGGAWINGRATGYLRGATYVDYTINGYEIYCFCTRTNRYLGISDDIHDDYRPWVEKSSRY